MALSASAQRIIGELEANTDMLMTPGDSALNKGKDSEGKPIVPVDVKAWTIDQTFGNRTTTFVDTLQHQFQNANLSEGINGHFSHLGNLGSPRINRIFLERQDDDEFIFLRTFDQFYCTDKATTTASQPHIWVQMLGLRISATNTISTSTTPIIT